MAEPVTLRPWITTALVHMYPGNDRVEHELYPGCVCEPKVEYVYEGTQKKPKGIYYTHHALDGRKN